MGTRRLNALTQDGKLCWGDVSQHVGDEDDHISEMSGEMGRQFQAHGFSLEPPRTVDLASKLDDLQTQYYWICIATLV